MIEVTTIDGVLRIAGEAAIPNAPGGQWDSARMAKLIETIENTIEVAEMVDAAAVEIEKSAASNERQVA